MRIASRVFAVLASAASCTAPDMKPATDTYGADRDFLRQHTDCIELVSADGQARVAVVGRYQGRVMTSSARGELGKSFGFIRHAAVASKETVPQMNVYGGEDRFWLGPEGGQFALYFQPGDPFDLAHWQTPALIDTEPFALIDHAASRARFGKSATLCNWSGTEFRLRIDRTVRLLDATEIASQLGISVPAGADIVAFATDNTLINTGPRAWTKDRGLLSIWILGMFKPSAHTTVVVPFRKGDDATLGEKVNDRYFGKVARDRLVVRDDVLFFKGDGQSRGKIGIGPRRVTNRCGSYDPENGVLTLVQFNLPGAATDYVNSMWETQSQPFAGDVVNAYNDGPPAPGKPPLGPFYELETSSPALALAPNQSFTHTSVTVHLQGDRTALDAIARHALGVGLDVIEGAWPSAGPATQRGSNP